MALALHESLFRFAAVAAALAGCSGSASRTSFGDSPADAATPDPIKSSPDAGPPVAPVGDASAPDAPDDCVRASPGGACGLVPQCGCAATETCDVKDTGGTVECVAAGKAAMGRACTSTAGCAKGLTCVGGTCHAYCVDAGSACGQLGTGACIQLQDNGIDVPNLKVCAVTCDLRDASACGGTTAAGTAGCVVDDHGNTDCLSVGTAALDAACSPAVDCAPSLVCVTVTQGPATSSVCKKWCRVGTNDCGAGVSCTGFQTKVLVEAVEYGVCP